MRSRSSRYAWLSTNSAPKLFVIPALLLAAAALSFLVGGCSPTGAPRVNEGEEGEVQRPLSIVIPNAPEELDPRFVWDAWGLRASRLIFASLFTIDPTSLAIVPDLAESYERPSPREWVVTLREGLRFADGAPLDAEDVVATYRGVVDPALGGRFAHSYARIVSVKALSPTTVSFLLDDAHAPFLTDLELPIVKREYAARKMANEELIGAGPYRLMSSDGGRLIFEANTHYHRGALDHPRVELVVVRDENTRALRLLGGRGDLTIRAISPLLLPLFDARDDFEIVSERGPGTTYLGMNLEHPALADRRVREALLLALDRELLVRTKLGGRGAVAEGFFPLTHPYAAALESRPRDLARARLLLEEAGARVRGAEELSLRLRVSSDRSRLSLARAIAFMLSDLGIRIEIRPSEAAHLRADLDAGNFDLYLMEIPELIEAHFLSYFFSSERIPSERSAGANRFRFRSERLDALFEAGVRAIGDDARREIYAEIQAILYEELPAIPLFHEEVVVIRRSGLSFYPPLDGRLAPLFYVKTEEEPGGAALLNPANILGGP